MNKILNLRLFVESKFCKFIALLLVALLLSQHFGCLAALPAMAETFLKQDTGRINAISSDANAAIGSDVDVTFIADAEEYTYFYVAAEYFNSSLLIGAIDEYVMVRTSAGDDEYIKINADGDDGFWFVLTAGQLVAFELRYTDASNTTEAEATFFGGSGSTLAQAKRDASRSEAMLNIKWTQQSSFHIHTVQVYTDSSCTSLLDDVYIAVSGNMLGGAQVVAYREQVNVFGADIVVAYSVRVYGPDGDEIIPAAGEMFNYCILDKNALTDASNVTVLSVVNSADVDTYVPVFTGKAVSFSADRTGVFAINAVETAGAIAGNVVQNTKTSVSVTWHNLDWDTVPSTITLQLYRDGVATTTQVLDRDDIYAGKYTFTNLELFNIAGAKGDNAIPPTYEYTVSMSFDGNEDYITTYDVQDIYEGGYLCRIDDLRLLYDSQDVVIYSSSQGQFLLQDYYRDEYESLYRAQNNTLGPSGSEYVTDYNKLFNNSSITINGIRYNSYADLTEVQDILTDGTRMGDLYSESGREEYGYRVKCYQVYSQGLWKLDVVDGKYSFINADTNALLMYLNTTDWVKTNSYDATVVIDNAGNTEEKTISYVENPFTTSTRIEENRHESDYTYENAVGAFELEATGTVGEYRMKVTSGNTTVYLKDFQGGVTTNSAEAITFSIYGAEDNRTYAIHVENAKYQQEIGKADIDHNKYIDYLGDNQSNGKDNQDTSADNTASDSKDLYRLYLDISGKKVPTDVMIIVDVTTSMEAAYGVYDGFIEDRYATANRLIQGSGGLLESIYAINQDNLVSMVSFAGYYKDKKYTDVVDADEGFTALQMTSQVMMNWWNYQKFVTQNNKVQGDGIEYENYLFTRNGENDYTRTDTHATDINNTFKIEGGTCYATGFLRAAELFNNSTIKGNGHDKMIIFISDGEPNVILATEGTDDGKVTYTYDTANNGKNNKFYHSGDIHSSLNSEQRNDYISKATIESWYGFRQMMKDMGIVDYETYSIGISMNEASKEVLNYISDDAEHEILITIPDDAATYTLKEDFSNSESVLWGSKSERTTHGLWSSDVGENGAAVVTFERSTSTGRPAGSMRVRAAATERWMSYFYLGFDGAKETDSLVFWYRKGDAAVSLTSLKVNSTQVYYHESQPDSSGWVRVETEAIGGNSGYVAFTFSSAAAVPAGGAVLYIDDVYIGDLGKLDALQKPVSTLLEMNFSNGTITNSGSTYTENGGTLTSAYSSGGYYHVNFSEDSNTFDGLNVLKVSVDSRRYSIVTNLGFQRGDTDSSLSFKVYIPSGSSINRIESIKVGNKSVLGQTSISQGKWETIEIPQVDASSGEIAIEFYASSGAGDGAVYYIDDVVIRNNSTPNVDTAARDAAIDDAYERHIEGVTTPSGEGTFLAANADELEAALESILAGNVVKGVHITDYLSQYVTLYESLPDLKVSIRYGTDSIEDSIVVWESTGGFTPAAVGTPKVIGNAVSSGLSLFAEGVEGASIIQSVTYTKLSDKDSTGKIDVVFNPNYNMDGTFVYTVSFNVKGTQELYDLYAKDKSYNNMVGDEGTDYPGNTTSSLKPGADSNKEATVHYSYKGAAYSDTYQVPVVQAVIDGMFSIRKVTKKLRDEDIIVPLQGAQFTLYRAELVDGVYKPARTAPDEDGKTTMLDPIVSLQSGSDGIITFSKTSAKNELYGTYLLYETRAPEGYYLSADYWVVTIDKNGNATITSHLYNESTNPKFDDIYVDEAKTNTVEFSDKTPYNSGKHGNIMLDIPNSELYFLPDTGGMGTYIFTILGMTLITVAVIIIRKQRETEAEINTKG